MAINAIQAAIRSMTGTERQFTGDFHAYWDQLGIPPGQFAERMAAWQNLPQNAAWLAAEAWGSDGGFGVGDLWKAGEQGIYLDTSDLSTMSQDAAGTLPVYAPGSGQVDPPVGRILDKSGRGNHAYQTTTTSRPTLSARYNALSASEKFNDSYWGMASHFAIAQTAEVADSAGGAAAWKLTSTSAAAALVKALGAGFTKPVLTVWCRAGSYTPSIALRNQTAGVVLLSGTAATANFSNGYGVFTNTDMGAGWRKIRLEITSGLTSADTLFVYYGSLGAIPVGQYFYLEKVDMREASDGVGLPPYQRVVDASTYDTAGFPLYLRFDGVDDWMQTASVDFSGTDKVLVSAAFRRMSDSGLGILCELTNDYSTSNGTLIMLAPGVSGIPSVGFNAKGTALSGGLSVTTAAAPAGSVATGVADIAAPRRRLRNNGVQAVDSTAALGAGNFGAHSLYIGRRGGVSFPFNGRLYSLLIRGAATPDATIAKVERHLNSKARIY